MARQGATGQPQLQDRRGDCGAACGWAILSQGSANLRSMSAPHDPSPGEATGESPTVIRDRAVAVADYLLAVRAQMERPARTVPSDAHWLHDLPDHPACRVGPSADGSSWLRVGLPDPPGPVAVPAELRRRLTEVSA